MTDQYGRGARARRVPVMSVVVLFALVSGSTATPAGAAREPSPTPAVRTTPAVQASRVLADSRIAKPTGMVSSSLHRGVVWMVSGRTLFAVRTSGKTVGVYTFSGPAPVAFEALAITKDDQGHPKLLIGDTGDPHRNRNYGVWLYEVPEPDRLGKATLAPLRYRLDFPDGPQDVRTLLVDPSDQRIYLVSMSVTGGNVYKLPAALGVGGMANRLAKMNAVHFVAQDGDFLPDGRVILRGKYQAHLLSGIGGKRLAYLQLPRQADGPLAVAPGGASVLVSGAKTPSRLWLLRIPAAVPPAPPKPTPSLAHTVKDLPETSSGWLVDHVVGVGSLAGVAVIAIAGAIVHLRRRSRSVTGRGER